MRKLLSEFFSESGKRNAKVFCDGHEYVVVYMNGLGASFKSIWDNKDKAEEFAEDWVLTNE